MTPIERTVAVLNRWCGENAVDQSDEKLADLWDRTKPTGKPSHDGIKFYPQGASTLIENLKAEFRRPEAYIVNIELKDFNPSKSPKITSVDDLVNATAQFHQAAPGEVTLTKEAHDALVADIVAQLKPLMKAGSDK